MSNILFCDGRNEARCAGCPAESGEFEDRCWLTVAPEDADAETLRARIALLEASLHDIREYVLSRGSWYEFLRIREMIDAVLPTRKLQGKDKGEAA